MKYFTIGLELSKRGRAGMGRRSGFGLPGSRGRCGALLVCGSTVCEGCIMTSEKLRHRRQFLHVAAGAAMLSAVSRISGGTCGDIVPK